MRLLLSIALAAVLAAAAAGAATAEGAPWWVGAVGAGAVFPPGPGVPLTIVDRGADASLLPPGTVLLDAQTPEQHGTALASVALAVYPQARLQIWDASPAATLVGYSEALGIEAAAAHCPGVIDLGFATPTPDPFVEQAVLAAVHANCLVVAGAGDGRQRGNKTAYPASLPHVLAVAATDAGGAVAPFSTAAAADDLSAPGDGLGSATGEVSGTSFAGGIVAAAAAWIWTQRPELDASRLFELLRETARSIGSPGWHAGSGFGLLDVPAALAAPAPPSDSGEPNDDVVQVRAGGLFPTGERPLTTAAEPSGGVVATLDAADDPDDLYPIWVPAHTTVHVAVRADGDAAARIWGPRTVSVREGVAALRRDLRGQSATAGARGFRAYVEVLLTGRVPRASYALEVRAARR